MPTFERTLLISFRMIPYCMVTSADDVVRSGGPSEASLEVPTVKEPRHSTVQGLEGPPLVERCVTRDSKVLDSDAEVEVVTKLVSNEIMKPGASSTVCCAVCTVSNSLTAVTVTVRQNRSGLKEMGFQLTLTL